MCWPALILGAKAVGATAATSGLFGTAGVWSAGQSALTLGTAASAFGAIRSGQTAAANFKYQAHMARYHAQINDNNALMRERAAEVEADLFDDRAKLLLSKQNVAFAKSGVAINQDTPLEVAAKTAADLTTERLAILYRGKVGAEAERHAAVGQRFAAVNAARNVREARAGGYLSAGATAGVGVHKLGLLS